MSRMLATSVLVVAGGGSVCLVLAMWLARRGVDVHVAEMRRHVAWRGQVALDHALNWMDRLRGALAAPPPADPQLGACRSSRLERD